MTEQPARLGAEAVFIFGDLHLGKSDALEQFDKDGLFAQVVWKIIRDYSHWPILRMVLNGDCFDPLSVLWRGTFTDPPYEATSVIKMREIINAHPQFFDALARFLELANSRLTIQCGNHDIFLVWLGVQKTIADRLVGEDVDKRERIEFVDQRQSFARRYHGVDYTHGFNADAYCAISPEEVIITHHFGRELDRPVLNMPLSSYLVVGLMNMLQARNPLVGRVYPGRITWKHSAIHLWGWSFYALGALIYHFFYNQFFAFWNVRRKSSFAITAKVIWDTLTDSGVARLDALAAKMLKESDARGVVLSHSHVWRDVDLPDGRFYLNPGSWTKMFRQILPTINLKWKRYRRLEFVVRVFENFFKTGELSLSKKLLLILGFFGCILGALTFMLITLPQSGSVMLGLKWIYLKIPVGVFLATLAPAIVFRFLALKPRFEPFYKCTFAQINHYSDGSLTKGVLEAVEVENKGVEFRLCPNK